MKRATAVIVVIFSVLLTAFATAAGIFIGLLRRRDEAFVRRFTRLQRDVLNPTVMKNAGEAGQNTAVIETIGRRTGNAYETPISPVPDADGWSAALVYGPQTAWARNAIAAGEAVLRIDGARHRVDGIEVVPIAETAFARTQPGLMKLFRVEQAVRMRDAGVIEPEPHVTR